MIKRKQIPTIIGLLILIIGMTAGIFLISRGTSWLIRATPETKPEQIKLTNITDTGFSVSWVTDAATPGFVRYGTTTNLNQVARDDRDELSGQTNNFMTHHITLRNLNPSTTYQFRIGSGGSLFDNNGQNYQLTTAPALTTLSPSSDVAYGNVNNQDGTPAQGALVYLSFAGTTTQSTLVKASGNWVIPLSLARSEDLTSYAQYDKQATIEEIFVHGGNQGIATVITTTKNDSPVPTISLGQNYDFRTIAPSASLETTETTPSKFILEEISQPVAAASFEEVTINNPQEQEEINTQRPEISGQGPAGKTLEITLKSLQTFFDTIIIGSSGNWSWTPPANLDPGEHTITLSYQDEQGETKSLTRNFTVLAAGTSDLPSLEATPSASPSPSPSASPSPSPRTTLPSTEAGIPDSGYLTPTFLVFIMGLALISFGLFSHSLLKKEISNA